MLGSRIGPIFFKEILENVFKISVKTNITIVPLYAKKKISLVLVQALLEI